MRVTSQPVMQPAFSFDFKEPHLAAHVERWARQLEARALSGERWREGQLIYLDGWPSQLVATQAGFELHEQDFARASHEAPLYLPGVTNIARWSAAQWELCRAAGSPFQPLEDECMHLQVCPRFKNLGRFLLARSKSLSDGFSGWTLQCGDRCRPTPERDQSHVEASEWRSIPLFEFMKVRPALVRYLALADGFLVDGTGEPCLGRSRADSELPATANLAMLDLPMASLWRHFSRVTASLEVPGQILPVLDFECDADVWGAFLSSSDRTAIVRERYGVNEDLAARAVAEALSPARLTARVKWSFREELPPQLLDTAIEVLQSRLPDPRRVAHAAAMKLRELSGRPFAPLMELAQRLDARLDEARRGRVSR